MVKSIGIFNPYMDSLTGVVRLTFDIAKAIKDLYNVKILTIGAVSEEVKMKYHNVSVGIEVIDNVNLKDYGLMKKIFYIRNLGKISRELNVDVLFFTDGYYLVKGFKNFLKILYVYFPYSLSYHKSFEKEVEKAPAHKRLLRFLMKEFEKFLIYNDRNIVSVIVYSSFVKRVFKKYFGIEPYVLMPPLDTDFFVPPKDLEFKFTKKPRTILCVTRFHPDKEHELVVEAFMRYVKRRDVNLVIAGYVSDKRYYEFIRKLSSRDNRIMIIPNPSDEELLRLYQEATLFWYVHEEHCATTPLEAMACATPVVMLNKPGLNEVVVQGVNGYLVNSLEELGRVTEDLLNRVDDLVRMGKEARKMMVKLYSYQTFREKLRDELVRVVSRGGKSEG